MKLLSCYIEGYGCLRKTQFVFDGGLTQILASNGEGKTTLASFLKAMLYGLKSYRKGSVEFCDREHFYPFEGGKFGGNLLFVWRGKHYKIERFFGARSETEDTLAVYENGDLTTALNADIGKTVLGLDRESFERTLFLSGGDLDSLSTSCINAAFVGVAGAGDERGVENALNALEKAAKSYKKSRGGQDKITALKEEISRLDQRIEAARALRETLPQKYVRLAELSKEIQTLSAGQAAAQQQSTWAEQWAHYQDLSAQATKKEWEYNALLARYPFGLPALEEAHAVREEQRASERVAGADTTLQNKRARKGVVLLGVAAAVALLGVIFLVCTLVGAGIALVAVAALLGGAGGALWHKEGKAKGEAATAAQDASRQRTAAEGAIARFERRYGVSAAAMEFIIDDIRLAAMLARDAESAKLAAARYYEEKRLAGKTPTQTQDGQALAERLAELRKAEAALTRDIEECERESEPLEEYENEKTALLGQLEECKQKHRLLVAAADYLARSERQLNERYLGPILADFLHYAALLEGVLGEKVTLTKDFTLRFERGGEERSEKHFSGGQRSLCALCFRLALVNNLYAATGKELPFFVLDDPFAALDEGHMQKAKTLLQWLAKEWQIVYFTCHSSRAVE